MKKFDIRKTFETFLKEPLSILTEGLFQIVNIESNIFNKESSFNIDFVNNKTQLYKSRVKAAKEKVANK